LAPGKYIIAVNAVWNAVANNVEEYRDLNIDVYTNQAVEFQPIEYSNGVKLLTRAMLDVAKNHTDSEDVKKFLEGNQYYGDNTRIETHWDKFSAGLGFIYTKNNSQNEFKQ